MGKSVAKAVVKRSADGQQRDKLIIKKKKKREPLMVRPPTLYSPTCHKYANMALSWERKIPYVMLRVVHENDVGLFLVVRVGRFLCVILTPSHSSSSFLLKVSRRARGPQRKLEVWLRT